MYCKLANWNTKKIFSHSLLVSSLCYLVIRHLRNPSYSNLVSMKHSCIDPSTFSSRRWPTWLFEGSLIPIFSRIKVTRRCNKSNELHFSNLITAPQQSHSKWTHLGTDLKLYSHCSIQLVSNLCRLPEIILILQRSKRCCFLICVPSQAVNFLTKNAIHYFGAITMSKIPIGLVFYTTKTYKQSYFAQL